MTSGSGYPRPSRVRRGWFHACSVALVLALPASAYAEVGPEKYHTQLVNIDASLNRLEKLYAAPDARLRNFSIQKRLLDARVFFELSRYENCAMVLVDIVDRPDFQTSLDYDASLLLLGQSLFELGNFNAAREVFRRIARGREPDVADEARLYLLEIALASGDPDTIAKAIAETPLVLRTDRMKYGLGKANFYLKRYEEASLRLGSVAAGGPFHARAQYYLAATAVARGEFERALNIYRELTTLPADDATAKTIRDEAWLAIGRLLVQKKNYALALTSYQNIRRYSPHYETALFEMAWAYINQEQYDKALQTVDVLLLNVVNSDVDVEANVLRGQLNVARRDYEEAIASYQAIIDRFAPIRNELLRFVQNPSDVRGYFEWLTRRVGNLSALRSPLSARAVAWLETSGDLARVSDVFDGVAREREAITTARAIGDELREILSDRGRVEVFPELKEGWGRIQVAENQLILMFIGMLDAQRAEVKAKISDVDRAAFDATHAKRERLSRAGLMLPSTFEAFNRRQEDAVDRFRALAQRQFLVQKGMDELQRQLLAIEKQLNERQFAEDGVKFSAAWETELRTQITAEKVSLEGVFAELAALSREIDLETRKMGAGDTVSAGEQRLKQQLWAAIEEEGFVYDRVVVGLDGEIANRFVGLADTRRRGGDMLGRMERLLGVMSAEVQKKTAELLAVVDTEMQYLGKYNGESDALVEDGDEIAARHGMDFFQTSLRRMGKVVLNADVGLLEVVWARKTEQTEALQRLAEDRSRRLKGLEVSLESIKSGAADEDAGLPGGGTSP